MSQSQNSDDLFDDANHFSLDELLQVCAEVGTTVVKATKDITNGHAISTSNLDQNSTISISTHAVNSISINPVSPPACQNVPQPISVPTIKKPVRRKLSFSECTPQAEIQDSGETGQPTELLHRPTDEFQEYSPDGNKTRNKKNWKRVVNYKKRMQGEEYVGFSAERTEKNRRTTPQNQIRKAREMGPPCSSRLCSKRKSRHCDEFTEEARTKLFEHFWKNMTWEEKRVYVLSLVDRKDPIKRTSKNQSTFRKQESVDYYLKLGGVKKQVCRNMFLQTLGIGRTHLRGWLKQPTRKTPMNHGTKQGGDSDFALKYLLDMPKLPSHYCRKDTGKLYLEPIIRNKGHLYRLYMAKCQEVNVEQVSSWKFYKLFDDCRISIHQPKKDQCDTCCSYQAGLLTEEQYKKHMDNKNRARQEKENDKANSFQGKCHVITMDLQSVLLSPVLNASALYYKTKLIVHNFTIYNLKTKQVKCFLWDETKAALVASVFATCVLKFLAENFKDKLPIIIFSDGCTNQNRNVVLSNAISSYAAQNGKVVIQKYLEKGHTQMEVDSVHANIEKQLKHQAIYCPRDYVQICERARKEPYPYEVQYMNYSDFLDYSDIKWGYTSIRPGSKAGDAVVTNIRQLHYGSDGIIKYKLNHDGDWMHLPRNPKNTGSLPIFSKLYRQPLPLPNKKYQDLMDLLHVIPEEYHQFYISLPVK